MTFNRIAMFKELLLYGVIALISVTGVYLYQTNSTSELVIVENGDYAEYGVTAHSPVIVYSATWCSACNALKAELKRLDVEYTNFDYEKDKQHFTRLHQNGVNVIPIIFVKNTMIKGFDKSLLQAVLEQNYISSDS